MSHIFLQGCGSLPDQDPQSECGSGSRRETFNNNNSNNNNKNASKLFIIVILLKFQKQKLNKNGSRNPNVCAITANSSFVSFKVTLQFCIRIRTEKNSWFRICTNINVGSFLSTLTFILYHLFVVSLSHVGRCFVFVFVFHT